MRTEAYLESATNVDDPAERDVRVQTAYNLEATATTTWGASIFWIAGDDHYLDRNTLSR